MGTFTPAAYGWESPPRTKPYSPADAPGHVVMTQEHNGRSIAGGNVDTGHTRTSAPCVWWNPKGSLPTVELTDQITLPGVPGVTYSGHPAGAASATSVAGAIGGIYAYVLQTRNQLGGKVDALDAKLTAAIAATPTLDYDQLAAALLRAIVAGAAK